MQYGNDLTARMLALMGTVKMTKHEVVHKIKFSAYQLIQAKAYCTSAYGNEHIDKALETLTAVVDAIGSELIIGEEQV